MNGSREPLRKLEASTRPLRIKRLADRSPNRIESLLANARFTGAPVDLPHSAWTTEEVPAPNVTDKKTLLTLARIAGNSYVEVPNTGEWEDVKGGFNYTEDFGWENDGLRGHIFADENNQTVVIGLKGTSTAVFDGVGSTTNDKINDNLFFSCCCGEGTSWWSKQVCDCQTATYTCNSTCVSKALREKNRYYYAAQELYYNVTALYPNAQVWLVGHSLGGSTSSLLAKTVGQPAVTFEAPGEAMAAKRLGLPTPPGYNLSTQDVHRTSSGVFHFGHTADPLFMGTCNGANSLCSLGGYAMESVCHTGFECVYDTMADRSWGSHLSKHRIQTVIHEVIEEYNETAECKEVTDCIDCFNWKYYESNSSEPTSTSSASTTSFTQTRTETCRTPGWWGCLDETTTAPTTTRTLTTTSCNSPGWFGCNNSTTIVVTTTEPEPAPTTSTQSTQVTSKSSSSSYCETPSLFWGCKDRTTPAPGSIILLATPTVTARRKHANNEATRSGL